MKLSCGEDMVTGSLPNMYHFDREAYCYRFISTARKNDK